MEEIGLPYVRIWENGSMYDHIKNQKRFAQRDGSVDIVSLYTGKRIRTKLKFLIGYFFHSPWKQLIYIPYCQLDILGLSKYVILKNGSIFSLYTMSYISGGFSTDGYKRAYLLSDFGYAKSYSVHRLVAKAFIPNPENKPEVNHIDGNKLNNSVDNLEWVYSWENTEHALKYNLRKSVLDDLTIHAICQRLQSGKRVTDIVHELHVPKHAVLGIKSGCHARIANQYNFPRNTHF